MGLEVQELGDQGSVGEFRLPLACESADILPGKGVGFEGSVILRDCEISQALVGQFVALRASSCPMTRRGFAEMFLNGRIIH